MTILSYLRKLKKTNHGFTMIELLIVITILGILAVAVLSAINPIEQINRGRDTGSQSDAEQLVSAIERYYAFNGSYPWQGTGPSATGNQQELPWSEFTDSLTGVDYTAESISDELLDKNELKESFMNRVTAAQNPLYLAIGDGYSDSTYVCFEPLSDAFKAAAEQRCTDGMPQDLPSDAADEVCDAPNDTFFTCLP